MKKSAISLFLASALCAASGTATAEADLPLLRDARIRESQD